MSYDPPTRAEMQETIYRALRDPDGDVFLPETINDFIVEGLSDMSAYRPKETRISSTWPLTDGGFWSDMVGIWAVQIRIIDPSNSAYLLRTITIPSVHRGEGRAGWDFIGGTLILSDFWVRYLDGLDSMNYALELLAAGYIERAIPDSDGDVLDLDSSTDYLCLLNHCKALGLDLLTHDRSLYQQWIGGTNNTDVSPTQLQGMASVAGAAFERIRARSTLIRRVAMGDAAMAY